MSSKRKLDNSAVTDWQVDIEQGNIALGHLYVKLPPTTTILIFRQTWKPYTASVHLSIFLLTIIII